MISTRVKTSRIKLFLRWKHGAPGSGGTGQQAVNVDAVIKAANVEQTASSWKKSALVCEVTTPAQEFPFANSHPPVHNRRRL